ncbi:MAG: universal stress protein [Alphaproteobacteria bacterium]|nr:universal stress protein [Alphaproteobacteria bacterium]
MKDLLVFLDGTAADEARIVQAEALASQHESFLTGLYCNALPEVMFASEAGMASIDVVSQMQDSSRAEGDSRAEAIATRFGALSVKNEVRRFDVYSSQIGLTLASEARTADLFIASRPYGHYNSHAEALEQVLFNSGRGCLFLPPVGDPKRFDHVVLAWRNTREAARAVSEALPILTSAKKVYIVMATGEEAAEDEGAMPGADISRYLGRHGADVELRMLTNWSNVGEALLNEVEKLDADLLVMGGYGHSRFREWVLGGATRDILTRAEMPVLIAH